MPAGLPPDDPYDPYLREIAGLSVSLARELHSRAVEAEDNDQCARLAAAFQKVSRGLRQTIALAAKLERDHARAEREDRDDGERRQKARLAARRTRLQRCAERICWDEAETDDHAADLLEELDIILDAGSEAEEFLTEPVEAQIERIREALGLEGEAPFPPLTGRDSSPEASRVGQCGEGTPIFSSSA
jgi:hypothetical protein